MKQFGCHQNQNCLADNARDIFLINEIVNFRVIWNFENYELQDANIIEREFIMSEFLK